MTLSRDRDVYGVEGLAHRILTFPPNKELFPSPKNQFVLEGIYIKIPDLHGQLNVWTDGQPHSAAAAAGFCRFELKVFRIQFQKPKLNQITQKKHDDRIQIIKFNTFWRFRPPKINWKKYLFRLTRPPKIYTFSHTKRKKTKSLLSLDVWLWFGWISLGIHWSLNGTALVSSERAFGIQTSFSRRTKSEWLVGWKKHRLDKTCVSVTPSDLCPKWSQTSVDFWLEYLPSNRPTD